MANKFEANPSNEDSVIITGSASQNILSNYSNVTQTIELRAISMAADRQFAASREFAANQGAVNTSFISSGGGITLAKQGSLSKYNIEELEILSYISPNHKTSNSLATEFNLTISEASGFSFFDRMHNAYTELGFKNFAKAPLYIIIRFYGTDSENQYGQISSATKFHRVGIAKCDVDHNSTGTSYQFGMFAYDDIPLQPLSALPRTVTLQNVSTVGDVLLGLEEELYTVHNVIYGTERLLYDQFFFKFTNASAEIANMQIKTTAPNTDDTRQKSTIYLDAGMMSVTFEKGTTINEIIDDLIISCEEWAEKENQIEQALKESGVKAPSKLWTILPNIVITGYDSIIDNYVTDTVYTIDIYQTNKVKLGNKPEDTGGAKRIPVAKRYEYLYTGKNTEVLDLNLQFNFAYYALIPLYNGDVGNYTSLEPTKVNSYIIAEAAAAVRATDDATMAAKWRGDPVAISVTQAERNRLLENYTNLAGPGSSEADLYGEYQRDGSSRSPLRTTYVARDMESYFNRAIPATNNVHANLTAAILNQSYSSTGDMVKIAMEIKGDPYWLRGSDAIATPSNSASVSRDSYILTTFRSPKQGVDSEGLMSWSVNETVSGAYIVFSVSSLFSAGKFTQTINAVRDSSVNYKQL